MFVFEVYLKASALEFRLDSQHPLQKSFPVFPIHEKMSGNLSQQPVRGGTFPCPQPCDCSLCVFILRPHSWFFRCWGLALPLLLAQVTNGACLHTSQWRWPHSAISRSGLLCCVSAGLQSEGKSFPVGFWSFCIEGRLWWELRFKAIKLPELIEAVRALNVL